MAIKILIASPEEERENVEKTNLRPVDLVARKTLDGNIMIMDHDLIDIVVMPKESKIITFVKSNQNDLAYKTQDRLFKFLQNKGFILPETIKSGNVHGSIEGLFPLGSDYANPLNLSLLLISEFVENEQRFLNVKDFIEDLERENLLEPGSEDSTELGEIPQIERKGTLGVIDYYPSYYYGHMY